MQLALPSQFLLCLYYLCFPLGRGLSSLVLRPSPPPYRGSLVPRPMHKKIMEKGLTLGRFSHMF